MARNLGHQHVDAQLEYAEMDLHSGTPGPEEQFPLVRGPIADSWRRSQLLGVDRSEIEPRSSDISCHDDQVLRCVNAVLTRNAQRLANEPVTIIFAAPDGSIIQRFCGDSSLARQLDSVHLAPGSGYDEETMGTNGIGTAVETASPMLVHGSEHYNDKLAVFTCAGQPVFHPLTGSLVGVVDITCYADDATGLLMTTAGALADQIEQSLLDAASPGETQLLREYLGACRHTSNPVIAQSEEVVMMNRHAQQLLTPEDRASLLIHSADFTGDSLQESVVADLPSGLSARLTYKPSTLNGRVVGGIVRVRLGQSAAHEAPAGRHRPLRGLVGTSPEWLRASESLLGHARRGTSVIVTGEPSVGRTTMTRAVHATAFPGERLAVIDCDDSGDVEAFIAELEAELDGRGSLLLRRIDRLDEQAISAVSELLVEHRSVPTGSGPAWIVATRASGCDDTGIDSAVLPNFDVTVSLPPLRHRPEDITKLAIHLLRRLDREGRVRFDDAALRHLSRLPWHGNLAQLQGVVRDCVQTKRSGLICIDDLPAQCDSSIRRSLTPIEAIQRDAIVDALRIHSGRKLAAANHLGISRATIYRKIREFGISVRNRTPEA
ncbi:sigma-54-dependent Fis family transcriptional regulator [Dietzia sp. PP-33]|jgi:transcriptional regulator of acetoin/glycerol metabolism|uniref:sigma-54-dependent Fis family transcriptional regulator n=1 Tax=Dietzia sp. PP-33 TaxID=2957500 RepID=UPI0029AA6BFF|nr:helix-turn-helix domain-containing protein [Dietzia sp. PP-33]MDX2357838.1 Fis family transcriptional regulator [Dietzia sp. PP-33]